MRRRLAQLRQKFVENVRDLWREVSDNPLLVVIIVLCFGGITAVGLLPTYGGRHFDAAKLGMFGDFVGGYFGPILTLGGIFFVILTLREQRQTTVADGIAQAEQALENHYYQLLRLHRNNVAEMKIDERFTGRKVFVKILDELQTTMNLVRRTLEKENGNRLSYQQQVQLAFYCVFFGTGRNSSPQLRGALQAVNADFSDDFSAALEREFSQYEHMVGHSICSGHQIRLGHYYRHLFQTVSFVHRNFAPDVRSRYMKTIRAQLSTQEQALLLANSLTGLGWDWWTECFLEDYGLVKNLPKGFVESYYNLDAGALFHNGYFEWQQSKGYPESLSKVRAFLQSQETDL